MLGKECSPQKRMQNSVSRISDGCWIYPVDVILQSTNTRKCTGFINGNDVNEFGGGLVDLLFARKLFFLE